MLRIDQLRLLPGEPEAALLSKCARLLRVAPSVLTDLTVLRRAIDAREGLTFVYTVAVSAPQEAALLASLLQKPEALRNGEQALADYIDRIKRRGELVRSGEDLRALANKYKETKGYEG